jgi:hypothetical protein
MIEYLCLSLNIHTYNHIGVGFVGRPSTPGWEYSVTYHVFLSLEESFGISALSATEHTRTEYSARLIVHVYHRLGRSCRVFAAASARDTNMPFPAWCWRPMGNTSAVDLCALLGLVRHRGERAGGLLAAVARALEYRRQCDAAVL